MLLLFGSKYNSDFLGPIQIPCPSCGTSPCGMHALRQKFTFFFVPTFTMGTRYLMKCGHCKYQWEINKTTARQFQLNPNGPYAPMGQAGRPGAAPGASGAAPGFAPGVPSATINQPGRAQDGSPQSTGEERMVCPSCGAVTAAGAFCSTCGAKLPPQR